MLPNQALFKSVSIWRCLSGIVLAVGFLGLTACQSPPSNSLSRTVTVSGKGEVSIPATLTQVQLGVEVSGKTAAEVQQQIAQRSQAVIDLLKSRQVEKLETTGVRLNPNYQYKDGEQTIKGYIGTNTVSFRLPTEKVGNLLDEAVQAGATRIDGVSFVASDDAIAKARQAAIDEATSNAQLEVSAALKALELQQREIVNVQVSGIDQPPMPMPMAAEVVQNSKTTPIIAGDQEVAAVVMLQVRY